MADVTGPALDWHDDRFGFGAIGMAEQKLRRTAFFKCCGNGSFVISDRRVRAVAEVAPVDVGSFGAAGGLV